MDRVVHADDSPLPEIAVPAITVGLISDTHGLLRPSVASIFSGVRLILHAGDVGSAAVLADLSKIAPVEAVYGNVDDPNDPMLARDRSVPVGSLTVHVSHGHELGRPTPRLILDRYAGDVLVFGHTHRALVFRDEHRLVVNPGAAGPRRFDASPSVAILTVVGRQADVKIVPLT